MMKNLTSVVGKRASMSMGSKGRGITNCLVKGTVCPNNFHHVTTCTRGFSIPIFVFWDTTPQTNDSMVGEYLSFSTFLATPFSVGERPHNIYSKFMSLKGIDTLCEFSFY